MKCSDVVEGCTQLYVNDKYGWETIISFTDNSLDPNICLIRTYHWFSSFHVVDDEIVDMDGRKIKLRNMEQLFLFNDEVVL